MGSKLKVCSTRRGHCRPHLHVPSEAKYSTTSGTLRSSMSLGLKGKKVKWITNTLLYIWSKYIILYLYKTLVTLSTTQYKERGWLVHSGHRTRPTSNGLLHQPLSSFLYFNTLQFSFLHLSYSFSSFWGSPVPVAVCSSRWQARAEGSVYIDPMLPSTASGRVTHHHHTHQGRRHWRWGLGLHQLIVRPPLVLSFRQPLTPEAILISGYTILSRGVKYTLHTVFTQMYYYNVLCESAVHHTYNSITNIYQ